MMAACSNKKKSADFYSRDHSSYVTHDELVKPDTVSAQHKKEGLSNTSISSSYRSNSTKLDNMHGFDPASEDDMDDNGMTRYMESTDEEGWE